MKTNGINTESARESDNTNKILRNTKLVKLLILQQIEKSENLSKKRSGGEGLLIAAFLETATVIDSDTPL